MSTESIGNLDLPVGHPNHQESEQSVAEILLVDSNEVTPEEAMFWRDAGLIFLKNLSKESFRLRFGSPKPEEDTGLIPIVDYFVFSQQHHHKMLLLMHEAKLIGACSIFDYPLRDSMGSSTVINTDNVVELAVTISDEQQGKKLGTVLLEQAVQVAGADGKTHVYTSFNSDNDRSRRLVERILGSANIVAGKDNLQDKFWRIPGVPADDYMNLENAMRLYCGDEFTEPDDTKRGNRIDRIGKFGRDILSKIPIPHDTESLDTSK